MISTPTRIPAATLDAVEVKDVKELFDGEFGIGSGASKPSATKSTA